MTNLNISKNIEDTKKCFRQKLYSLKGDVHSKINNINKEGKGLMGFDTVISAQIVNM